MNEINKRQVDVKVKGKGERENLIRPPRHSNLPLPRKAAAAVATDSNGKRAIRRLGRKDSFSEY